MSDEQVTETILETPEDVPVGPAPLLRGDAVPLPGFSDVEVADSAGVKSWQA